jgi:hypothetical protein
MTLARQLQDPYVEEAKCSICWESRHLRPDPKEGIWLVCGDCYATKFETAMVIPGSQANGNPRFGDQEPGPGVNPALEQLRRVA